MLLFVMWPALTLVPPHLLEVLFIFLFLRHFGYPLYVHSYQHSPVQRSVPQCVSGAYMSTDCKSTQSLM